MKTFKIFLAFIFLSFVSIPIMAQETIDDQLSIETLFASFAGLVAGLPILIEVVKGVVKPTTKLITWITSFVTGIIVSMAGWFFNLGFFLNIDWWQALSIGILATLAANGLFDSGFYTWVLQKIGLKQ